MSAQDAMSSDTATESSTYWFEYAATTEDAITIAMNIYGAVPPGWQRLWRDTVRQLLAVRTPARERSLGNLLPDFDTDSLDVTMPFADRVMLGIARRCTQRSRCTCRQCGRPGRPRWFNAHEAMVLCPRCAAPELLRRAIDDLVRYPGLIAVGGCVDGPERVPEVLRRAFRRRAEYLVANGTLSEPSMKRSTLDAWTRELKCLQRFLPPSCIPVP
ncbi:hypothetical protein AVHY2522_06510 [Acidovorax sp. SUPP2522]|jgi:hypothetical protein|uniref:hypothetical protein n=1 Tax=unclassified Acidovorax TaxID=2684926 RepID=UPI00234A6F41|nr:MULTISPECIES: hypothetical protein [unclassified Acidovorax]WCM96384.1 hypothetical protein M5C96_18375 [Acidovorax sp. GBBC 1281]GKT14966.1 hypothetical protein AVHY2522_06510 [Acidovorax sp. SUPP2522]